MRVLAAVAVLLLAAAARAQDDEDCLNCHGEAGFGVDRDGRRVPLFVDAKARSESVHARVPCVACHEDLDDLERFPHPTAKPATCTTCHEAVVAEYGASVHAAARARGNRHGATCADCHDPHATKSRRDRTSPTWPRNVPDLCATCHNDSFDAPARTDPSGPSPVSAYPESVHGRGLRESGLVVSATCVSCHGPHRILAPRDPASPVHRANVAATCGKCHEGIRETFLTSVHAQVESDGTRYPPTCYDCHTSHTIGRADGDFRSEVVRQCGGCHPPQARTYFDTFHGKAAQLGGAVAAKCHDCHGTHDIRRAKDPASHVAPANRVATCSKCHDGAHEGFAGYLAHVDPTDGSHPWLTWTWRLMTALLVGTMGLALLHSLLRLVRLWTSRSEWKPHLDAVRASVARGEAQWVRRFRPGESALHAFLVMSFLGLALTGMALRFGWTAWAGAAADFLGGFQRMGTLHRLAATLLAAVFVAHLVRLARVRKESGLSWFRFCSGPDGLVFSRRDLSEFAGTLRWFLGRGPRPRYGRFTYWEKFDYFAVFWGVLVIGLSGTVLWFPEAWTRILPGEAINVAAVIHGDEALLAVAFIFTTHFFNTQFRPDKFPIDVSIFVGRLPLEEWRHERPEEYDAAVAAGRLDALRAPAPPPHAVRWWKVFGSLALLTGLLLVAGIVAALLTDHG